MAGLPAPEAEVTPPGTFALSLPPVVPGVPAPQTATPPVPEPPALHAGMPTTAMLGRFTVPEVERLAYELTMVPEAEPKLREALGLEPWELDQLKRSPIWVQVSERALKELQNDSLAGARTLARAALPQVIMSLNATATSRVEDAKDRTAAAKVLIELAEANGAAAKLAAKGHGSVAVQINFGATVGAAIQQRLHQTK